MGDPGEGGSLLTVGPASLTQPQIGRNNPAPALCAVLSYPMAVVDYGRGDSRPELGQSLRRLNRNQGTGGVTGVELVRGFTLRSPTSAPS